MGKSCVHFKSANDLPLELIGSTIAAIPMEEWIEIYEKSRKAKPKKKTKAKPRGKPATGRSS
jgi:hypothetical protein